MHEGAVGIAGAEADALGLGVHEIIPSTSGGRLSIEMHVEVPADRTVGKAHAEVTELEHRLRAALPELPYACGLGTVSLFESDVTLDPLTADDGAIRVRSDTPPQQVLLWQATNTKARDFRVATIGRGYRSTELKPEADGSWVGRGAMPEKGWTASFVEVSYMTETGLPFKV